MGIAQSVSGVANAELIVEKTKLMIAPFG